MTLWDRLRDWYAMLRGIFSAAVAVVVFGLIVAVGAAALVLAVALTVFGDWPP